MIYPLLSVTSSEDYKNALYNSLSLKFSLRSAVKNILSGVGSLRRISSCGTLAPWTSPALAFGIDGNPYFLTENCGSSSCPYCATRCGAERLKNLEDGINSFHMLFPFGCVVMLVLTFSHHAGDVLSDIGKMFSDAKHLFFQQCKVKSILASLGCIGRVTAPETTWSPLNGFHPHEHILFFFESASDDEIISARESLFPYWLHACEKVGLKTDWDRFYFKKQISAYLQDYVTKCAREVTLSDCKKGFSGNVTHYSPFQLVSAYMETEKPIFSEKFVEYAAFSKGRKSYNWSKGLAEALLVKKYSPGFSSDQKEKKVALENLIQINFSGSDFPDALKAKFISEGSGDNQQERLIHFMSYIVNSPFRDRISSIRIKKRDFTLAEIFSRIRGQGIK